MTIWLEKLLVPDLLEAYLEHGYGFNFGYAVAADSIGSEDSAKDLVAALDLDGPEGPLAGAEVIHTLRFPLMPTDTVYPAMGGTTDEERAVARGDFLEFPPFNGSGVIDLPSDPQASYLYVDPTILRAGAQDPEAGVRRSARRGPCDLPGPVHGLEEIRWDENSARTSRPAQHASIPGQGS